MGEDRYRHGYSSSYVLIGSDDELPSSIDLNKPIPGGIIHTNDYIYILNRLKEGEMEEWHSIYSYKNRLALYKMYIKSRNYLKKAYFT